MMVFYKNVRGIVESDLSKINHEDNCRFFDDGMFCSCGADAWVKVAKLEDENKRLKQALNSAYQRCNLDHATKDILYQALFL